MTAGSLPSQVMRKGRVAPSVLASSPSEGMVSATTVLRGPGEAEREDCLAWDDSWCGQGLLFVWEVC